MKELNCTPWQTFMEYLNKTVNSVNEEKYRLLTPLTLQLFLYPTPAIITTITKEKKKICMSMKYSFTNLVK